jgi:hypothetical protein
VYNNIDDSPGEDANRAGFENTRTKLIFSGNVGSPDWMYKIEGNFDRDGGGFDLLDAWIGYDMQNGWRIFMGQLRVPLQREWLVGDGAQLAVDRSNVNYDFGGTFTQGIMLNYSNEQFRMSVSFNDGVVGFGGTGGNIPWDSYDTEYAFTGRAEVLFSGTWEQFEDFTSPQGSEQGIMVGVAGHWQNPEYGDDPGVKKDDVWTVSGDVSMEFDGWNLFGAINYQDALDSNPWGIVAQGGFYLTDKWEIFARYEWLDFDDDVTDDLSIITFGVNGYYSSNVKMTADFGYGINAATSVTPITGWRDDFGDNDGQMVLRAQLQLSF